jgi:starch synthase
MRIAMVASECVPFASTGGLGEVVGALSAELARQRHEVTVYAPFYSAVRDAVGHDQNTAIASITIPFEHSNRFARVVDGGRREGAQFYFIDCPEMFGREGLYGGPGGEYGDNWERFGLFCRAVLEASKQLGVPEVFHLHDWQAAMTAVYLRTVYLGDAALREAAVVMTIHNAGYQGTFAAETVERLLLPWAAYTPDGVEHYGRFNFLKGGIVFSDQITTVSRRYAEELQTPEIGASLDGVLRWRRGDLRGILNGVDYSEWDPGKDGRLAAHYTSERLEGKRACRADLLHAFGLESVSDGTAVLGIVSRLAHQKGIDLLAGAADGLNARDVAVVILGTGEPYYEGLMRGWAELHSGRVATLLRFDDVLAHKVMAGSDMVLMPSRYEPCGLNQMYAMRYGTAPVVRATGGLDDTVEEWDAESGSGTGFKFSDATSDALLAATDRALAVFADGKQWTRLMRNGMVREFSWAAASREYAAVYGEAARRRASRG